ncbi:MAG: saccharopine dehydrogenase family protein [Thermoplasmataceae archaeon]
MRDYAVIGGGHIGKEIAGYLSNRGSCVLVDPDREALNQVSSVEKIKGTIETNPELLTDSNVFVVALPGQIAKNTVTRLLKSGKRVVDVSFYQENPFIFQGSVSAESAYIPDCGFAPGLSNIMAGHLFKKFDTKRIGIYVGGLPMEPRKPFLHSVTWSVEGLIDEYVRPAKLIKNGVAIESDPLEKTFNYQPRGFTKLEGFYSDGLRTLLSTLPVKELFEITLRYKGHLKNMKFLKEMGYFREGNEMSPRKVTERIFSQFNDTRDISILDVISLDKKEHRIELRDYGNDGLTSMAKLTGHTAAITATMLTEYPEIRGFLPPEEFGKDEKKMNHILNGLRQEGVKIEMT